MLAGRARNSVMKTPEENSPAKSSVWANVVLLAIVVAILLVSTEVFFRYQPFVMLDYPKNTLDPDARLSMLYHHKTQGLGDPQLASVGACESPSSRRIKVLFLGDSWMEPIDGIPRGFAESLVEGHTLPNACFEIINGGTRSYSPSLILVKGRKLIAENEPDFIVVHIDETDVMDETVRYSRTTLRGPNGEMERVVPGVADLVQAYERPVLVQQRWHTLRLIEQLYYENVLMPRIVKAIYGTPVPVADYSRIMAMQLSTSPQKEFRGELDYFRARFREMLGMFVDRVGAQRVLISRHPHYLHLSINGARPRYNDAMTHILAEETERLGVTYYDAALHLTEIYGDDPAHYMRWPADPYSHLTDEGFHLFGRALGKSALDQVTSVVASRQGGAAPASEHEAK